MIYSYTLSTFHHLLISKYLLLLPVNTTTAGFPPGLRGQRLGFIRSHDDPGGVDDRGHSRRLLPFTGC